MEQMSNDADTFDAGVKEAQTEAMAFWFPCCKTLKFL